MNVLIYGAGQLARMMYLAGAPLGIKVNAVDVATNNVVNPVTKAGVGVSLAQAIEDAVVLSAEFEHVPEPLLEQAQNSGKLRPSAEAILTGADRVREKALLDRLDIANCAYRIVTHIDQLDSAVDALGTQLILKASRDGYDGYGQWRLTQADQLEPLKQELSSLDLQAVPLVVEQMVSFDRELSLVGARDAQGNVTLYPLAENLHYQGQLHVSVAPAPFQSSSLETLALDIFTKLTQALDYVGVLAVEMFQMGEQLLVNEIAPRVHNSGHWSMQGADTCQFENHLRAVCGLPLGNTEARGMSAMINVIGTDALSPNMLSIDGCHLHLYDKSVRPKRKLGHINLTAATYPALAQKMEALVPHIDTAFFPKLTEEAKKLAQISEKAG